RNVPAGDGWLHDVKFDSSPSAFLRAATQSGPARRRGCGQRGRWASELCQAACAFDQAGHNSAMGVRLARALNRQDWRPQQTLVKRQAHLQALLALRLPSRPTVRNIERRTRQSRGMPAMRSEPDRFEVAAYVCTIIAAVLSIAD